MTSSSDEKKLVDLLAIIGKVKSLTEVLENEILSIFDSRGENAVKVLKENNLRKLILDENICIWEVKGRSTTYIVIENNFCECTDFQFRVLRKGQKTLCYHLLAKIIGEKLEVFNTRHLSTDEYNQILEQRIKNK
ncbi:MAG: SWIM zinc finger family protein [Candidatus Heimdallarchaeota archaeon]|nr:SWIM zinc finger family protein [Candidatus Heimdallarchaeota archaeon]MCK4973408.1 SWIM zinc finger family protein [Candidatus Heimdallarchaeota archaeon]